MVFVVVRGTLDGLNSGSIMRLYVVLYRFGV